MNSKRPDPGEIYQRILANQNNEEQLEALHQILEKYDLFDEVLCLMNETIEVPEDSDEDVLSDEEAQSDEELDLGPRNARGLFNKKAYKVKQVWTNWLETTNAQPMRYYTPGNIFEIRDIIREAEAHQLKVRAFGSGHGLSDVATTTGYLIDTSKLQRVLPLDPSSLKPAYRNKPLFQVEAGIKIKRLNRKLKKAGLALSNMGGSDVQSIVGAISTSTHGSGIGLGPLPSMVRSLVLVTTGGRICRIEPTNGITQANPTESAHGIELIQDDHYFNAALVSMGCMGVIYSVILEVEPAYQLTERRVLTSWNAIKPQLQAGGKHELIRKHRHFELIINPHQIDGDHACIVTTRNYANGKEKPRGKDRRRDFLPSLVSSLPLSSKLIVSYFKTFPWRIPKAINRALKGLEDEEFTNHSYKVLNQGTGQLKFIGCAVEVGVAMSDYIDAIEKIFQIAERFKSNGRQYLTSPIGVRFVAPSDAYLSMMHGAETCMIEIPTLKGTPGWQDMIKEVQLELTKIGGKPHWGLDFAQLNGNFDRLLAMYPQLECWQEVYQEFNAKGTFNNSFTNRMGFSNNPNSNNGELPLVA